LRVVVPGRPPANRVVNTRSVSTAV
jgi:hypothetical protein